jgi:Flp pilus assembly protein protease CpaA
MAKPPTKEPSGSNWMSGLIVMIAVAVAYVGFARVSVAWTLAIATVVVICLVLFLWRAGARE